MSSGFKRTAAAIAMSAFVIAPIATAGLVLTTDAAFAKSAKGASKSSGKNARGMYARELKNMNAVNSWKNGQGKYHANATSNIGLIATYYDFAVLLTAAELARDNFYIAEGVAAAEEIVGACGGDPVCLVTIPTELGIVSAYADLVTLVDAAMVGSDLAFGAVAPDGLDPDGDAMAYFFDTALGF